MSGQTILPAQKQEAQPAGTIELIVKHQGVENRIIGTPDSVIGELLSYFSKLYPLLELISKVVLTPDNTEFLQACSGVLASSQEGLAVLKDTGGLRDKELIILHLSGSRLMHILGRKEADASSLDELTKSTGRSTGTVAGRLSELCNEQLTERVGKGSYRLTTMGTRTAVKTVLAKAAGFPEK